jgi:hypothetical protein
MDSCTIYSSTYEDLGTLSFEHSSIVVQDNPSYVGRLSACVTSIEKEGLYARTGRREGSLLVEETNAHTSKDDTYFHLLCEALIMRGYIVLPKGQELKKLQK